jgi:hypothetical protein
MEKISASSVSRLSACHASADLGAAIPGWQPPVVDPNAVNAASRGTVMHQMFSDLMGLTPKNALMMERALGYVNTVRSLRRFKVLSEVPATAEWLVTKPRTTADLVLYVRDEIHVFDLKTGMIEVPIAGNQQLLFYAACYEHLAPDADVINCHIVQPWADNMGMFSVTRDELDVFKNEIILAEMDIMNGSKKFQPGDHCKFCPANPHSRGAKGSPLCPVMMELLYPTVYDEDAILNLE